MSTRVWVRQGRGDKWHMMVGRYFSHFALVSCGKRVPLLGWGYSGQEPPHDDRCKKCVNLELTGKQ